VNALEGGLGILLISDMKIIGSRAPSGAVGFKWRRAFVASAAAPNLRLGWVRVKGRRVLITVYA